MTRILFFLTFLLTFYGQVAAENLEKDTRTLINLLDYIHRDYVNACANGKIIDKFEYQEMAEFSVMSIYQFKMVSASVHVPDSASILNDLSLLEKLIGRKSTVDSIQNVAGRIKKAVVELDLISQSAAFWPDLEEGRSLYSSLCSSCHGPKGDGRGSLAAGLNPSPSSFIDPDLMENLSPLQIFNTTRLGLPGTAMQSFATLSDEETWALAFYILSLRYEEKPVIRTSIDQLVSIEDASALSDKNLENKYGKSPEFNLSNVRNYKVDASPESSLDLATTYLKKSLESYKKGSRDEAIDYALRAYLEGVEPVEHRLSASDSRMVGDLEKAMMLVRKDLSTNASTEILSEHIKDAEAEVLKAKSLLSGQEKSFWFTVFLAASILIREGLEAFLIVISIIGILRSFNARNAIRWVHSGWLAALFVGIISWTFVDSLMEWNVQKRELMEGLIGLFAAVVLVFMGFWMHSKTEITKWRKFVEEKIVRLLNTNNLFGLALFSFVVVFREAFESVIFLSSLSVGGHSSNSAIWLGLLIAGIIVASLSWGILNLYKRINIRKVFLYSSIIIVLLAIILSGKGVHALQESGIIDASPIALNLRITFLGVYPTLESLLSQLFALVVILGLWFYNSRQARLASVHQN